MTAARSFGVSLLLLGVSLAASAQEGVRPPAPGQAAHNPYEPIWVPVDEPGKEGLGGPAGSVRSRTVLDDVFLPFARTLGERDHFGGSVSIVGDLNGDGRRELAIGAPGDYFEQGAVWLFSLLPTREVDAFVKLGPVEQLLLPLEADDRFGASVAAVGDLDGNGFVDLAVGAPGEDDGLLPPFGNAGAVHILFLRAAGRVLDQVKISNAGGGLSEPLDNGDAFGASLAPLGDLDGDGVEDLAVGAPGDDDGGPNRGALWILYLNADGSVRAQQKISQTRGGFGGTLANQDGLGTSLAVVGDLDGNGVVELASGTPANDTGLLNGGALWILFLQADGNVASERVHSGWGLGESGFWPQLGVSVTALGDLDGDGVEDLACGTALPSDPARVRLLFLDANGSVLTSSFITGPEGTGFGTALASAGDLDGDGLTDLVVGAPRSDARAEDSGGLTFYNLNSSGGVSGTLRNVDAATSGLPIAPLFYEGSGGDRYGQGIAPLGDMDDDGRPEVAMGAPLDDDGALDAGAVWIHYIRGSEEERRVEKISNTQGNLMATLPADHQFGRALAYLGYLDDMDGIGDLAVGARDAVWILFLQAGGAVRERVRIDAPLSGRDFGKSLAALGDMDGNGCVELAVGAPGGGGPALHVLFLQADGSVAGDSVTALFGAQMGTSLVNLGDLDQDGIDDLATGGTSQTQVLFLNADGSVRAVSTLAFGASALASGDFDGDGSGDLAYPVPLTGPDQLRIAFLRADGTIREQRSFTAGRNLYGLGKLGDLSGDGVPDLGAAVSFGPGGRGYLLELAGRARVSFEHTDDLDATPLTNGRAIPVPHPGRTFVISSSGANLGAAVFDSTPGGPNETSQDRDLLVGSRNLLILQDSLHPTQTVPGVFDFPDDDRDGGSLSLDFPNPVRLLSIELVDIDRGAEQAASVELTDDAGRLRIYSVPPGWTEDIQADGPPGFRTLDLTALSDQPGFASTATATETPGFDGRRVVRLEVFLGSSGAIDDIVYDPHP